MRRLTMAGLVAAAVVGVIGGSSASAQQQVSFSVGGFSPKSEDSRTTGPAGDVLANNLDYLAFRISDFGGPVFGGEYIAGIGDNFDLGFGAGYYQRSVPTVYTEFVNSNGSEIEQTLRLRVVPLTATVRWLPMGHHNGVEPYIGAGIGVFNYRYSESGQFLATDSSIFHGDFVGSGTTAGPVILGGIRIPVGTWGVGGELRWHSAEGTLPKEQDFSGNKIDLGGLTYTFTINVRF